MTHQEGLKNVETLINRFGGMRPMSRKMDVAVSTIQGWKKRDYIPAERVEDVVNAAQANNVSLEGFDVANNNDKPAESENLSTTTTSSSASAVAPKKQAPEKSSVPYDQKNDVRKLQNEIIRKSFAVTASVVIIVGGLGYFLFADNAKEVITVVEDQERIEREVTQLETRFNSFEDSITNNINSLNGQVSNLATRVQSVSGQGIRLDELIARFDNLTRAVDGQGNQEQAFNDLRSIVNSLQGRIESMDQALDQAKAENAEIAESMQGVTGRDLSAAAMLLAMTSMRDNMNRAQPFADDLAILQQLVGNDDPELTAAINRLAPYAENGILTPEGLSNELRGVTGDIVAAALRGEDVSIQDQIMARLGQILSVEKNGEPILGIQEQAIVARAQQALDRGDVQSALTELQKLDGGAADAANPITRQLEGAVNADQTMSRMMQTLLNKLQDPQQLRGYIQSLPDQIERQMQGNLYQDDASGIIILE
jgi:hypothetical protein